MKRVTNAECARAWAQGKEARSNNMRSEPPVLYSYGTPIACRYPKQQVTLVTSRKYSITTSCHVSLTRNWHRDLTVPNVLDPESRANVRYLVEEVRKQAWHAVRARKYQAWHCEEIAECMARLRAYCHAFGHAIPNPYAGDDRLIARLALLRLQGQAIG